MGYVPQEPTIINTDIYKNIRMGRIDATREEA
jgi:ABC-type multidrug transport system fused ATPase/permease subunit